MAIARRALEGWRELEKTTGQELLLTTGGLTVADRYGESTSPEALEGSFCF